MPGNPGKTLELSEHELPLRDYWNNGVVELREDTGVFDVTLQSLHDGVLVSIEGTVDTVAKCSRCLDPVEKYLTVDETAMYFYPGAREAARAEGDEEWEDILEVTAEDEVDLEPVLRDAIVLAMDNLPLCKPDCQGLCPECGERLEDLPPDHAHEVLDPRWAALGDLAAQLKADSEGEEADEGDNNK